MVSLGYAAQWLRAEQQASTAFKVIASGAMWSNDGDMLEYQANREAIFDFIVAESITGVMYDRRKALFRAAVLSSFECVLCR